MRIGIDGRLWSETGVGRYIRNLVENLQEIDRVNDYVLFLRSADAKKFKVQNSKFKVVQVDIRWHTISEQIKFPHILNKENLDLMHFPYFSVPVGYRKPFVITIHDLIINHFPTGRASTLPFYIYQMKHLGYRYVISKAVASAKKIIVPLNAVKEDLVKTLGVDSDKIAVTYEGFDTKIFDKNSKFDPLIGRTKFFLYVGNAYPHKNLEKLIKAFSFFRQESEEDIKLLLVGKEDYFYKKLKEKIAKERYSDIIIRNNVKDKELSHLYKNALGLISPSLMEGFGLPVLEAMASGCIVLASDIPSLKEVCTDSAIYFDPNSIEDMKNKLLFAVELNKLEMDNYKKKGFTRAKYFSWNKMARETLDVYENSISLR